MLRTIFIAAAALLMVQVTGGQTYADQVPATSAETQAFDQAVESAVTRALVQQSSVQPLGLFTVGDSADYNMSLGFLSGTAHMFVKQQVSQGFWVETDINISMLGQKQTMDALYAPNGKVLQVTVNGQQQTPPDPSQEKVVDMHKDTVTVPKGTFVCMYIKIHDNSKNTDSEVWVNKSIPIGGMVKEVSPSPMLGNVTLELTNFVKN